MGLARASAPRWARTIPRHRGAFQPWPAPSWVHAFSERGTYGGHTFCDNQNRPLVSRGRAAAEAPSSGLKLGRALGLQTAMSQAPRLGFV